MLPFLGQGGVLGKVQGEQTSLGKDPAWGHGEGRQGEGPHSSGAKSKRRQLGSPGEQQRGREADAGLRRPGDSRRCSSFCPSCTDLGALGSRLAHFSGTRNAPTLRPAERPVLNRKMHFAAGAHAGRRAHAAPRDGSDARSASPQRSITTARTRVVFPLNGAISHNDADLKNQIKKDGCPARQKQS